MIEVKEIKKTLKDNELVVLEFSSDSCAPCDAIRPVIRKILSEREFENVVFVDINLTRNPEFSVEFGVFGVPTIIVFKNGSECERYVGYINEKKLRKLLGGVV